MVAPGTVLAPKDFRHQMEHVRQVYPEVFRRYPSEDHNRVARNLLYSNKVCERAEYGPLADFREVVALRIAPWLNPKGRQNG